MPIPKWGHMGDHQQPACYRQPDGEWRRGGRKFLVPVKALSAGFGGRFSDALERGVNRGQLDLPKALAESPSRYQVWLQELRTKTWNTYVKRPFAGPEHVLRYLARYTHRVAISNGRLLELDGDHVVYRYKQYRENGSWRTGRMHGVEFVRRFTQYVLPRGFVRIRYYGVLSNRRRRETVEACRAKWGEASIDANLAESLATDEEAARSGPACGACGAKRLVLMEAISAAASGLQPRAPP